MPICIGFHGFHTSTHTQKTMKFCLLVGAQVELASPIPTVIMDIRECNKEGNVIFWAFQAMARDSILIIKKHTYRSRAGEFFFNFSPYTTNCYILLTMAKWVLAINMPYKRHCWGSGLMLVPRYHKGVANVHHNIC